MGYVTGRGPGKPCGGRGDGVGWMVEPNGGRGGCGCCCCELLLLLLMMMLYGL